MKRIALIFKNDKFIAAVSILLLLLAIFSIVRYKLNLGSDLSSKVVMQIKLNDVKTISEVKNEVAKIKTPQEVEQLSQNTFNVYFSDVSKEEEKNLQDNLKKNLTGLSEEFFYTSAPPQLYQIKTRVISIVIASIILFFVYYFITLKNHHIARLKVFKFTFSEFFTFLWQIAVVLGSMSLLGRLGIMMDNWFFASLILASILLIVSKVAILLYFTNFLDVDANENDPISKQWPGFTLSNWTPILLILGTIVLIGVLPMFALGKPVIFTAAFTGIAIILIFWDNFALKLSILLLFERLNLFKKSKFLQKSW